MRFLNRYYCLVISVLLLSCKEGYVCECTTVINGVYKSKETAEKYKIKNNEEDLKTICEGKSKVTVNNGDSVVYDCSLSMYQFK